MRLVWAVVFAALMASSVAAATPQFLRSEALRLEASKASAAGNYAAALAALSEALKLRPGHPDIMLALASAQASAGDGESAMTLLQQVATMGLTARIANRPEYLNLALKPRFIGAKVQMDMNAEPKGAPVRAFALGDGAALFEGIEVDGAQAFAGSVRQRRIVRIEGGVAKDFIAPGDGGLFSVYGLAIDAERGLLWAASTAGALTPDLKPGELGASGIFAFDLATGALKRKAVLGPEAKAVIGDVAVAADGTVYASDGGNGALWRLAPGAETLQRAFEDPRFVSPQGLVITPDQHFLIVADYAMGLYVIDLERGKVASISVPSAATALGIDGLSLTDDGTLIATQNGISPERVIALDLDEEFSRVERLRVITANGPLNEGITLAAAAGPYVYYVTNAPWGRFDADGKDVGKGPFTEAIAAKVLIEPPAP